MFTTIYTGMSGLVAYSKGLDIISNNVTNLNTPGFKGSDLIFRDIFYRYNALGGNQRGTNAEQTGNGVLGNGTSLRFAQGDIQDTGNALDVAIDGNGMFVLRSEAGQQYSRAGQFEFDQDGFLVDRVSGARIAGLSGGGITDININGLRTNPAEPTSRITFRNNLSTGSSSHAINNVNVVDTRGAQHAFSLTFANNNSVTPRSWLVTVRDENGATVASGLEVRFQGNGSPASDYNHVSFSYQAAGADQQQISLFIGEPGAFTGATSFSAGTTSDMAVANIDGHVAGALVDVKFETNGALTLNYSNGESVANGRLALAWFDDLQSLRQTSAGRFEAPNSLDVHIGAPTESRMGRIVGSNIEVSNVDLTREFTDLIIMQRGYQASSQVVSASNEMMQQLLDIGKTR